MARKILTPQRTSVEPFHSTHFYSACFQIFCQKVRKIRSFSEILKHYELNWALCRRPCFLLTINVPCFTFPKEMIEMIFNIVGNNQFGLVILKIWYRLEHVKKWHLQILKNYTKEKVAYFVPCRDISLNKSRLWQRVFSGLYLQTTCLVLLETCSSVFKSLS